MAYWHNISTRDVARGTIEKHANYELGRVILKLFKCSPNLPSRYCASKPICFYEISVENVRPSGDNLLHFRDHAAVLNKFMR